MALGRTAASVFAVMEPTHAGGHREIQLVAAQHQIADPPARFPVTRLAEVPWSGATPGVWQG